MKRLLVILFLLSAVLPLGAQKRQKGQQPTDSLVRLMSAQSAELIQEKGRNYRKVIGPARFLHNKTYLICDTAYWDVDIHIIKAFGHVRILQDETVLTSEKLDYFIDDDLAQFRGTVVQLQDKERNTLRTRYLDYNTKDSVAIFKNGGAMRDKDGQLIESNNGSYDSKTKIFHFQGNVNMFTDSVFVKTEELVYQGNTSLATFDYGVDIWRNANMLSARRGEYDRNAELFHFYDEVHGLTEKQEGWADTLHFNKLTQDIELHGNVQITDDEHRVSGMGEDVWYVDSLDLLTMSVDATIIAELEDENNKAKPRDTLYMAADRIVRHSVPRCDLSPGQVKDSDKRKSDLQVDPVSAYRKKAYEEAKKKADEEARKRDEAMGKKTPEQGGSPESTEPKEQGPKPKPDPKPKEKTEEKPAGSDAAAAPADSAQTATPKDTTNVEPPKDTTKISFIKAVGSVRVFKSDMQARCDSLLYSDLDSLALLYLDPVVWNEGNRQYVSDSIAIVVEDSRMKKANLMSNAFITIQEDSLCFDQIRGAEMMAFFDSTNALERFDALGGASAVFYLEENDALATVNKVESKMLSAYFEKGEIQRIYYFEKPHNDAYPTVQLPNDDRQMKGFRWDPDKRPTGMVDITPYKPRLSERAAYEAKPQAKFPQTEKYFPGYMKEVYAGLAARDSAQRASRRMRDSLELDKPRVLPQPDTAATVPPALDTAVTVPPADTAAVQAPELPEEKELTPEEKPEEETPETGPEEETQPIEKPESGAQEPGEKPAKPAGKPGKPEVEGEGLPGEEAPGVEAPTIDPHVADSIARAKAARDSLRNVQMAIKAARDSARAVRDSIQAAKDLEQALKQAFRDSVRQVREAKHEARWAELDRRDAIKDSIRTAKKLAKYRKEVARKLEIRDKEAAREQARLEKYIRHYEKIKAKRDEREAKHPERALKKAEDERKKILKAEAAAEKKAAKAQAAAEKKAAKNAEKKAQEAAKKAESKKEKDADKPRRDISRRKP